MGPVRIRAGILFTTGLRHLLTVPTSELEDEDVDEFGDRCVHVVRLYASAPEKVAVEANSPSAVWRASNRNWLPDPAAELV